MKSRISKTGSALLVTAIAATGLILSGCGGYNYDRTKYTADFDRNSTTPSPTPKPSASPSPTASPSPSPAPIGVPPMNFRVGAIGYTETTIEVEARKVLKVRFTPGVQDETVADTGFAPQYSKLGVYITVGTGSQPTAMLSNGLVTEAQSSTLNFSSYLPKTCAVDDLECREVVTIKISKPNYDYWCLNYNMYCPWSHVYETHPWHGELEVQTDDTDPLTE